MYQIDLARVCHEAHRAYCLARGDLSIPSWETLAEWQRENVIVGVMVAYNNPALTPEELHEAWMAEKVAAGWTVGPVKAPDLKQHPCLIDFDDLKPEDQAKDELFIAIVRALAPVTRPPP